MRKNLDGTPYIPQRVRLAKVTAEPRPDLDGSSYHAYQMEGQTWHDAARRIARKLGYSSLALIDSHIYASSPNKHTYLVQFGKSVFGNPMAQNLSGQYCVTVEDC